MKIDRTALHPLYDQYSNQENRLTHALLHTTGSSQWLFVRFLKDIVGIQRLSMRSTYEISTQKVPFSLGDDLSDHIESVPDAWIVDGNYNLGIAIEVKGVKNSFSLPQLNSHAKRVADYAHSYILVITPDFQKPDKIRQFEKKMGENLNVVWQSWDDIYRWVINLPISKSTNRDKERFLVDSMKAYLERRREVLGFQGIFFPHGSNVTEAKDILNAEMEALEPTVRKVYKDLGKRRPAITTMSKEAVWDCFGHEDGFTSDIHITLAIHERHHDISITVPNSAGKAWSNLKKAFSEEAKLDKLFSTLKDIRKSVPHVFIEFNQRHFVARKIGYRDGFIEFNIDTLGTPFRNKNSKVKESPVWLPALKEAIL